MITLQRSVLLLLHVVDSVLRDALAQKGTVEEVKSTDKMLTLRPNFGVIFSSLFDKMASTENYRQLTTRSVINPTHRLHDLLLSTSVSHYALELNIYKLKKSPVDIA